jgi:hypothetical protein
MEPRSPATQVCLVTKLRALGEKMMKIVANVARYGKS